MASKQQADGFSSSSSTNPNPQQPAPLSSVKKSREKPFYMLVFHELLKKHSERQPKYQPIQTLGAPDTSGAGAAADSAQPPSGTFSNTTSLKSVQPGESSSGRQSGLPSAATMTRDRATSQQAAVATATQATIQTTSLQPSSGSVNSQSAQSYPLQSAPLSSNQQSVAIRDLIKRINQLECEGHATSRAFNGRSRPSISPDLPPLSQGGQPPNRSAATPAASREMSEGRLPLMKGVDKVAGFKDSAPNISQTPAAVIGNSGSLPPVKTPNNSSSERNKLAATDHHKNRPKRHHDHTSLAKTIVESLPKGFHTLGPGFNQGTPAVGFAAGGRTAATDRNNALNAVPSDYEHIFHAPSNIEDKPNADTVVEKEHTASGGKHTKRKHSHQHNHKPSSESKRKAKKK